MSGDFQDINRLVWGFMAGTFLLMISSCVCEWHRVDKVHDAELVQLRTALAYYQGGK